MVTALAVVCHLTRSSAIAVMVGATERVIVRLGALVAGVVDASEHQCVTFVRPFQ